MSNFRSYPKIGQFRNVVKEVLHKASFVGMGDDGQPVYDSNRVPPILSFTGTVKLHGTNAAVGRKAGSREIWVQRRKDVVTEGHMGFYDFVQENLETFHKLFDSITLLEERDIIIYGEWCGGNIQKNVAISQLDKMFVYFTVVLRSPEEDIKSLVLSDTTISDLPIFPDARIWNITHFPTFNVEIDFSVPHRAQEILGNLTTLVEQQCPVGKAFGCKGIGEGIVWKCDSDPRLCFKVKGEKHSATKVKTLAPVDCEKMDNAIRFVEYVLTDSRLNQALENIDGLEKKYTGQFLSWIHKDVLEEESDTLTESNLIMDDVKRPLSTTARSWFLRKCEEL